MKKFKKPLSLVLVLTMISSMFSVIDFSLFASAEDSVTTVTYTEDFQNGVTNWEVKNLLDGKITEPAGYAVQMNVVTPDGETEALQPLYYAYDSENDSYTTAGSVALSGYNATAAIFKSDVVPDNFTKKTITGTLKTKDAKYSGSGGKVDSNVPRIVIGEDASGNPISVALYKNEETTAAILPVTYVKAEDNVIYVTQDGSKVWNDVWADRHNTINLNPGRSDGNGGYWGPTINYEIVITPNAAGTYDTKVTFTNTYSGTGANATTATATSTVSGILSKVTSFGINVSGYTGKDRNQYGAYDNVNIVYEVPKKTYESVTKTYTDDFSSPDTTKTKWTIKNLSESVSQAEGYKADFFFATPWGETPALQANYAAYDSETSTYSAANIQDSFNATAFIFNEDVVPAYFSKKTITGKAKLHDSNLNGNATPNNSANRFLIGYDASGNAITPAFGKNETTVTAAPNTKLNLSTAEITGEASSETTNKLSFYPTRDDSTGWWGPYIEFKIEITSNLSGTYDATITISNPTAQKYNETNETDTYVSTRT
ncbi:MAG: hypothetical protein II201_03635, partial [Clostridia bacterium]|nr:hypothetical protein [Clostridia bacterium]